MTFLSSDLSQRLDDCYDTVVAALLDERDDSGHWSGELSTSPLSTATAVVALEMYRRDQNLPTDAHNVPVRTGDNVDLAALISGGLDWLVAHQNDDGGWGDTVKSFSNLSTTMLAHAAFHAAGRAEANHESVAAAQAYIDRAGGIPALLERYGKDRTFSIPILTHCALAGTVDWRQVLQLPFELAWLPARFYKTVRLPVVSYALPALIAIGQVRFARGPGLKRGPLSWLRRRAIAPTLAKLKTIQPTGGGFLEATPLTSFVCMSLAGKGLSSHEVVQQGVSFIARSVRPDGSWPIDTNLATWVTTLSMNGLGGDLPEEDVPPVIDWLLDQQYREIHPFTNADPGGWAWTDLPGGVPDADDTPGAMLALIHHADRTGVDAARVASSLAAAAHWLLGLQNSNGGWPTFCRGWGTLPFDRSSADITAHALRALSAWLDSSYSQTISPSLRQRSTRAITAGFDYLRKVQRDDGSWLPLWFGNQYRPDDENPVYGTARVLAAYRDTDQLSDAAAVRGLAWLVSAQNSDGGWGGGPESRSSVEETSLAVEIVSEAFPGSKPATQGLCWLLDAIEQDRFRETAPIGFYFAKLWYFEKLYPLTFLAGALRRLRLLRQRLALAKDNSETVSA